MRRSYLSMTWTADTRAADAHALIKVVEQAFDTMRSDLGPVGQFDPLPVMRLFGAWTIPDAPPNAPYRSINWFTARCLDDSGEAIRADRYLRTVALEPWQSTQPHFDLCLTSLPLSAGPGGSDDGAPLLGVSRRGMATLISTHPLAEIEDEASRKAARLHVYAHFLGQLFDVPDARRGDGIIEHDGMVYCTESCALRHTVTVQQALAYGREESQRTSPYCAACRRDLTASLVGYHYGLN